MSAPSYSSKVDLPYTEEVLLLPPSTPIEDAARLLIGRPLRRTCRHFAETIDHPYVDPEHVHQLRVCGRRADAALKAFSPAIWPRDRRALTRAIKVIRQAAGQARDADVLIERLQSWRETAPAEAGPAIDFLLGYAEGKRAAAQRALERAHTELPPKELRRRWKRAVKHLHAVKGMPTLGELARSVMPGRIEGVLTGLDCEHPTPAQLHGLRIEGKRARYSLELFAGCIEESAATRGLEALAELQETLGSLNDSVVALARLDQLRERVEGNDVILWRALEPGFDLLALSHRLNQVARMQVSQEHREVMREILALFVD